MSASLLYFDRFGKPEDELAIIERAKRNPEYFAPLYRKYHEAIFRYVIKRVDEEESAYDITSCVFIKALTNLPKYEYRGIPFSSWLFRIAKSELYQSFRDKKARRTVSIDSMQIGKVMEEFQIDESEHKREVLLKVLPLLKESQLQLIEMRFFEKRSFREMGEILDLTENNAKVKTFRALIKLKELYSKNNNIKN
ncbi:MAG: sigma-70 family RNA polymerase sigma factor [Cryomorphaceae bacterium]|jgi:RNA polymerase sigma-70 factor (ECF subfamily)|nr:sigma-70 family RNA polymerase sigma factor [Cryomorphaceae bacterium]